MEHYWTALAMNLSLGYSDEWILAGLLLGRDNGNIWDSRRAGRKTSGARVFGERECFT